MEKAGDTFRKLYVPPLGPLDDPAGVIYLDGNLTEKTVDSRVLDSVGEGIYEARKELYDLGTRRRTLVEEIRAQKRRVWTENLYKERGWDVIMTSTGLTTLTGPFLLFSLSS